jgi:hypothetical protein
MQFPESTIGNELAEVDFVRAASQQFRAISYLALEVIDRRNSAYMNKDTDFL